jgi:hypothetical protein
MHLRLTFSHIAPLLSEKKLHDSTFDMEIIATFIRTVKETHFTYAVFGGSRLEAGAIDPQYFQVYS